MMDQEINRAIAEHIGARFFTEDGGGFWVVVINGTQYRPFTEDLNAMHEAEKTAFASSTAWAEFALQLMNVLMAADMSELDGMTCVLQASARQRAEAFLRTVGKWKDNE